MKLSSRRILRAMAWMVPSDAGNSLSSLIHFAEAVIVASMLLFVIGFLLGNVEDAVTPPREDPSTDGGDAVHQPAVDEAHT